jgi:hypothetical protein
LTAATQILWRGVRPAVVAALATVSLGLATAPPAAAESPAAAGHFDAAEPATALANPATVFLKATWTGVVRDRGTGAPISAAPIVVERLCSAVVVNPAGYAVSTSLCVTPTADVLLANALSLEARARVARGALAADRVDAYIAQRLKQTEFTGTTSGRLPKAALDGWLDGYHEGDGDAGAVRAAVVYAQPTTSGDVAVVKLSRTGMPAVEIVPDDTLRPGRTVVLSGYGGDGQEQQTYTLRNRTTTVGPLSGTNRLTVVGDIGPQARGGAVVDSSGRLLALQDTDVSAADDPVRDLVKSVHILRALASAKVTPMISATDRAYRAGLSDYFAGHFTSAVGRFDALLAATPTYVPAQAYRDRAVRRRDVDGDAIANAADWRTYGLSAAAGVAILVLLHLVGRRRREGAAADGPGLR